MQGSPGARTELLNRQHPHTIERQHVTNAITGRDRGSHPGPRAGKGGGDVKRTARFAAAAAVILVAGAVGWGMTGAALGDELLKIGAPVAATGPTAREGVLTKQGYDLWAETVNTRGGIRVGGKAYKVQIVYYDDQSKPQTSAEL